MRMDESRFQGMCVKNIGIRSCLWLIRAGSAEVFSNSEGNIRQGALIFTEVSDPL